MKLEEYLNKNYMFKYNEVLGRAIYKPKGIKNRDFELLKEFDFNSIYRELKNKGIKTNTQELRGLLKSDFVTKFNPLIDYFEGLPKWDGKTDYINLLSETLKTTDDKLFKWAFKKWLVALVSCAIDKKSTNQTILILTSGQGLGKTTWTKNLVPEELQEYFYSGNIKPNNKDTTLLMSERLLINMDELASFSKNQIEAFKEMITKDKITERKVYGQFTEDYIRRASFIGSSNHSEILMDVTGNRRFLCFECVAIDYEHNIDLNLVFSQVMSLVEDETFKSYFDSKDVIRLEDNNKMFVQSSLELEWIEKLVQIPKGDEEFIYANATDIQSLINKSSKSFQKISIQEIGKIMKSKGFDRKKVKDRWKYLVTLKK